MMTPDEYFARAKEHPEDSAAMAAAIEVRADQHFDGEGRMISPREWMAVCDWMQEVCDIADDFLGRRSVL